MILSVSRRTDIPNYYADWFFNCMKEGFVYVRNPMNPRQVSEIRLSSDVIDCMVFWTKNPAPMLPRLGELKNYPYYFQFTLTGYGVDMERNVPDKKEIVIPAFQRLSEKIGPERVIWRYDPILFNEKYTPDYHLQAFEQTAAALRGYTRKCVISFVDRYAKNSKAMDAMGAYDLEKTALFDFAGQLSEIARANGMEMGSCAEEIDLESCGIRHNCCIDKGLIESLIGCRMDVGKDKYQREACGCVESVDIGVYNTCKNGCAYCYANHSLESVIRNCAKYDPKSPLLCGEIGENDQVTVRQVKAMRDGQMSLFDT